MLLFVIVQLLHTSRNIRRGEKEILKGISSCISVQDTKLELHCYPACICLAQNLYNVMVAELRKMIREFEFWSKKIN